MVSLGISPVGSGPIGVLLIGHNDSGEQIESGAYGPDVFTACDLARAHIEHELWDFSFIADDYKIFRWPERMRSSCGDEMTTTEEEA